MCKEFKTKYGYSEKTIRRKIKMLSELKLVEITKSNPVMVNPITKIEKNVSFICTLWNMRDRHGKQNF